eukprot:scaffold20.g7729.t1
MLRALARELSGPATWQGAKAATLHTEAAAERLLGRAQVWHKLPCDPPAAARHAAGLRALLPRSPQLPVPAGSARAYAGLPQPNLQEAAQRLKEVASAVRAAPEALARAPSALYRALPGPARQLVDAAQTPGAMHRVVSLQLEAFWQHHSSKVLAAGGGVLVYALWRATRAAAGLVAAGAEPSAAASAGLLALSASLVSLGYLGLRMRYRLDPQTVYRLAVLGAPLAGSEARASVLTGGKLKFSGLRPRMQSRRLQMIFPLKGTERRGLVSLEAKKRHGRYSFKLLAVDVPAYAGGEQRIFIEGGPSLYDRGGVLTVLRDPFVRALSLEEAFVQEDETDDEAAAAARERARAARAAARAARGPQPLDAGGGLFLWERGWLLAKRLWKRINFQPVPAPQPLSGGQAAAAANKC